MCEVSLVGRCGSTTDAVLKSISPRPTHGPRSGASGVLHMMEHTGTHIDALCHQSSSVASRVALTPRGGCQVVDGSDAQNVRCVPLEASLLFAGFPIQKEEGPVRIRGQHLRPSTDTVTRLNGLKGPVMHSLSAGLADTLAVRCSRSRFRPHLSR